MELKEKIRVVINLLTDVLDALDSKDKEINSLIAGQETLQNHLNTVINEKKKAQDLVLYYEEKLRKFDVKLEKSNTSVSLIDGHAENSKKFWEDTH